MEMEVYKFNITKDLEVINEIVKTPKVFRAISDDFSKDINIVDFPSACWILVQNSEDEVLGAYMLQYHNTVCYEVHTCLLPKVWGKKSKEIGKQFVSWVFKDTPCHKIITHVPEDNELAYKYAVDCGLKLEGVNYKSFMRNGELLDQFTLGVQKGEWGCPQ